MKILVALLCLLPGLAWGQAAVRQSGTVTPYDIARWRSTNIIDDPVNDSTSFRGVNPFAVYDNLGEGICLNSHLTDNASNQEFCIGHNSSGMPVFTINNTAFPFLGVGNGNVVGAATTIDENLACFDNTTGTLIKDCGTIPSRTYWANTVTGNVGANLVGGLELNTTTTSAISQTDIGKINAFYVNNTFAAGAGEGQRASIFGKLTQNGAAAWTSLNYQYNTGIWSWVLVNQGNTTVGQAPNYMGYAGLVEIGGTNTRANNVVGMEIDVNLGPTVVVGNRIGYLASIGAGTFGAPTRATSFDGGYALGRATSNEATWKYGYMVRGPDGVWPFANDSILYGGLGASNSAVPMGSPAVAALAGTGIDLTGITFTFQEYISDHFQIDDAGRLFSFGVLPHYKMRDTNVAVTAGGLTRWASIATGNWAFQINTAAGGDFTTGLNAITVLPTGVVGLLAGGISGTLTPVNATGLLGLSGIITTPTVTSNGSGYIYLTTVGGVNLIGSGSTSDLTIRNTAGTAVWTIPAGGPAPNLPAVPTGTPVASLCIDASNNIIKKTTAGSCV